jgi:DNA-binding CsgD family transcriptional regulator
MIWKTNHGSEFFKRFCTPGRDDSIDNCLTYEHSLYNTTPFIWHDLSMWENASPKQMAHALAARDLGLFVGFTLPTTYFGKERYGSIGVSVGEHTPETFYEMWKADQERLFQVLETLDTGMREKYLAEMIQLSKREKETIQYFAAGLRAKQVAEKLGVGVKAIEKYIESARKKLKAKNRDQAIAKALVFNVI